MKSAPARNSLAVPLILAVSAPVAVVYGIENLHSVWWTLGLYQLAICLCIPAAISRLEGRSWREHGVLLGLQAPGVKEEPEAQASPHSWQGWNNSPRLSWLLGLITAFVSGFLLVSTRGQFLDPARLRTTLAQWGVSPERLLPMLCIMAVLDAAVLH